MEKIGHDSYLYVLNELKFLFRLEIFLNMGPKYSRKACDLVTITTVTAKNLCGLSGAFWLEKH